MKKHSMPQARKIDRPNGLQWELSPQAVEGWTPNLMAADTQSDNTISILDVIGQDPWTGDGVTAKRIAGALRGIGANKDVVVSINSPGGDLVEGIAIYNMLRDHKGDVTVKVLGMAASAASIIAMAGDEILIAKSARVLIHDSWVVAIGNRLDLRAIADELEPFDIDMAEIYAARTGIKTKTVLEMMDAITVMNGPAAIDKGFADDFLPADQVATDKNAKQDRIAAYLLDMGLAKAGMPRSERRALLQEFKGTPRATGDGTPSAADQLLSVLQERTF